jgi:hypothetical protein
MVAARGHSDRAKGRSVPSPVARRRTGSIGEVRHRGGCRLTEPLLNDLSGYLTETGGWEVLSLPAIAEQDEITAIGENAFHRRPAGEALHPELESLESLKALQRQIGSDVFAAQYQQSPVPAGGAMIRRDWLRYYDRLPERTYRTRIIQSWDTASKDGAQNDWSVCTTWMLVDKCIFGRPRPRPLRVIHASPTISCASASTTNSIRAAPPTTPAGRARVR